MPLNSLKTGFTLMSSTKMNHRVDFGKIKHLAEAPDLLDIQGFFPVRNHS
jgi:DNA-directed RNA polymerase subunit beta